MRTRAGRGAKSAPSPVDRPDIVPPAVSPSKRSPALARKAARSASNISANSFEAAPEVYASFEHPLLMVFGLPAEFFHQLKKHHGKLPKERKPVVSSARHGSETAEDGSESEHDSEPEDSDLHAPVVPQPAPRGGRGRGRASRGRGGRGGRPRGRGGRGRGASARTASPSRACKPVAPGFPLTEEEYDQPSNQTTPAQNAKPPRLDQHGDNHHHFSNSDDEADQVLEAATSDDVFAPMQGTQPSSAMAKTPLPASRREGAGEGSYSAAPARDPDAKLTKKATGKHAMSKPSFSRGSASQIPRDSGSTPAEPAVPKLVDPEDDILSDSDLPEPFVEDAPWPKEADCDDRADYLLQTRFKPMTDLQSIIASLTRYPASQRSTATLYALAKNAQHILKAWQDEYLALDARTAPHMHPPKLAMVGGSQPPPKSSRT